MKTIKTYHVDVYCDDEYADVPIQVMFQIDKALAERIIKLSALVKKHKLFSVEFFGPDVVVWDGEYRMIGVCVQVHDTSFCVTGSEKYSGAHVQSETQSIEALAEFFKGVKK